MKGSPTTLAPATAGCKSNKMSWCSRVALLALAVAAVLLLPGLARAANPAADINQCRNGAFGSEVTCTDAAWQNGDLGATNSHYREGDSVPFRAPLSNLASGESYTLS